MTDDATPRLTLVDTPGPVDPVPSGGGSADGRPPTAERETDGAGRLAAESAEPIDPVLMYEILATRIRGKAADWSPSALQHLHHALLGRFGPELGADPEPMVARLIILARNPAAA